MAAARPRLDAKTDGLPQEQQGRFGRTGGRGSADEPLAERSDPDGRAPVDALRRPCGGQRPVLCRRPRRHHRADRPQRRRQDDRLQLHHRASTSQPRAASRWSRSPARWTALPRRPSTALGPPAARISTCSSACPRTRSPSMPRVARTFQNIRLFGGMTVLENLMVAQHNKLMRGLRLLDRRHSRLRLLSRAATQRRWTRRATGWSRSISSIGPTIRPPACPTARSGGWRSSAPCVPIRCCSASTSRRPASTRASRPTQPASALHPRQARHLHPAHRARHGRRHGDFGPHRRARLRRQDFRRPGRFRAQRPARSSPPILASTTRKSQRSKRRSAR